jgi:hypothetical protein
LLNNSLLTVEQISVRLILGKEVDVDLRRVNDNITGLECGYLFANHPSDGLDNVYKELLFKGCTARVNEPSRHGNWNWGAI